MWPFSVRISLPVAISQSFRFCPSFRTRRIGCPTYGDGGEDARMLALKRTHFSAVVRSHSLSSSAVGDDKPSVGVTARAFTCEGSPIFRISLPVATSQIASDLEDASQAEPADPVMTVFPSGEKARAVTS